MKMTAEVLDVMGDDLMVVNVARVSMAKHHKVFNQEADTKLINYCAKHGHWSVFSHPKVQLRLTLPVFVARQWEKHRIGAVRGYDIYDQNEVSRRYVDDEPTFLFPEKWRARPDGSIKQGSGEPLPETVQVVLAGTYGRAVGACQYAYREMLNLGVAPEMARLVLPQSMFTQWVETGSLVYWSRVYNLRVDAHAQQEIQDLARKVGALIAPLFPVSWPALTGGEA